MTDTCLWKPAGRDDEVWDTSCGESIVMDDGTPFESRYAFCMFCGGKIVIPVIVKRKEGDLNE